MVRQSVHYIFVHLRDSNSSTATKQPNAKLYMNSILYLATPVEIKFKMYKNLL